MKNKFVFLKSAVLPQDYPEMDRYEIAVAGRSNSGKSSFINALAGQSVARVSQQPGKTTLLNFFNVGESYRLVDTPGYGFSRRSGEEQASWQKMMETYFSVRGNLKGILLLIDYKRTWEHEEVLLYSFANKINLPLAVLLTKCDRGKEADIRKSKKNISALSKVKTVFSISSEEKKGLDEVEEYAFENWIKPALKERN